MSAKKVSIINMKGGVGKTMLSIHLAYYLSKYKNKRVFSAGRGLQPRPAYYYDNKINMLILT
jgi:Flp pilus assembly CpaE family ATPase